MVAAVQFYATVFVLVAAVSNIGRRSAKLYGRSAKHWWPQCQILVAVVQSRMAAVPSLVAVSPTMLTAVEVLTCNPIAKLHWKPSSLAEGVPFLHEYLHQN